MKMGERGEAREEGAKAWEGLLDRKVVRENKERQLTCPAAREERPRAHLREQRRLSAVRRSDKLELRDAVDDGPEIENIPGREASDGVAIFELEVVELGSVLGEELEGEAERVLRGERASAIFKAELLERE
jgi:hypothetical protein